MYLSVSLILSINSLWFLLWLWICTQLTTDNFQSPHGRVSRKVPGAWRAKVVAFDDHATVNFSPWFPNYITDVRDQIYGMHKVTNSIVFTNLFDKLWNKKKTFSTFLHFTECIHYGYSKHCKDSGIKIKLWNRLKWLVFFSFQKKIGLFNQGKKSSTVARGNSKWKFVWTNK